MPELDLLAFLGDAAASGLRVGLALLSFVLFLTTLLLGGSRIGYPIGMLVWRLLGAQSGDVPIRNGFGGFVSFLFLIVAWPWQLRAMEMRHGQWPRWDVGTWMLMLARVAMMIQAAVAACAVPAWVVGRWMGEAEIEEGKREEGKKDS